MVEPRRCRTGGCQGDSPRRIPVCRERSLPARVRSVRTFGRSSTRPATTIISIEPPRSDLSPARGEVLRRRERCGLGTLPCGTPPDGTPPDLGGGQAPQARPRPGGDGRDEDRRAQDHQRRSLAAGEIQAAGAAGAIKNPLPQSASSTRGRGECPHDLECCACKSSRESAVGRLAVAESTKVPQLHSAMGPFTSPCIYL